MPAAIARLGRRSFAGRLIGAGTSGFLLYAAFPPLEWSDAAWFALIPLLLVAVWSDVRQAARWGFVAGLICWLPSLSWVLRLAETSMPPVPLVLVGVGWIGLAACCAIFVSIYAALIAWIARLGGIDRSSVNMVWVLVSPLFWIGLEEVRGRILSGFPWNPLAASQYANLSILQIVSLGGAPLLSAVIVLLNTSLALTIARRVNCYRAGRRAGLHVELMIGLAVVAGTMVWSVERLQTFDTGASSTTLRIGVVQPNIPQARKWSEEYETLIYTRMQEQTRFAFYTRPDVVVWPETAIPGTLKQVENFWFMEEVLHGGVPVLVGVMRESQPGSGRYYNSSVLFPGGWPPSSRRGGDLIAHTSEPGGEGSTNTPYQVGLSDYDPYSKLQIYDKQHLVPFGEYVPFARLLAMFSSGDPLGWSCLAGRESMVFHLGVDTREDFSKSVPIRKRLAGDDDASTNRTGGTVEIIEIYQEPAVPFAVLICFEDVFRSLARKAVLKGARLLINQTNDAWFDGTAALRQHMTHTVLRCVENRVPAVRVGNSGLTCAIDALGRITYLDQDDDPLLDKVATAPFEVDVPPDDMPLTRFTRTGSGAYMGCGVAALVCFVLALVRETGKDALEIGPLNADEDNL